MAGNEQWEKTGKNGLRTSSERMENETSRPPHSSVNAIHNSNTIKTYQNKHSKGDITDLINILKKISCNKYTEKAPQKLIFMQPVCVCQS